MHILLTNDDGIFAPGIAAMERALRSLGEVSVVAPSTEQSGVGHAITFLTPLTAKEVFDGDRRRGWAVDGSPADAVKLGISAFCPRRPDLVVSGINGGLNAYNAVAESFNTVFSYEQVGFTGFALILSGFSY
jgi:5'-nucleotidase